MGWGGLAGWMKYKIRLSSASIGNGWGLAELGNKAELGQLELVLGLILSLENLSGGEGGMEQKSRGFRPIKGHSFQSLNNHQVTCVVSANCCWFKNKTKKMIFVPIK